MKLLAFDNSSSTCLVAAQADDQVLIKTKTAPMQQARFILPMIDEILAELHLSLQELDAIAYGCGPGSFTGIRLATSVAQGLSYATSIPLLPISSLAILAQSAFLQAGLREVHVAVDARMEEVYYAHYSINQNNIAELQSDEIVVKPIDLAVDTIINPIGDGWEKYSDQFKIKPKVFPSLFLDGHALLDLAKQQFLQPKRVLAASAIPVYLR